MARGAATTVRDERRLDVRRTPRIVSSEAEVELDVAASQRGATLLPAELLRDDEIILLLLRPSLLYIPLSCVTSLVFIGFVAFLLAYVARWQEWVRWTDSQALGLGIVAAALRLGWQTLDWYGHVYVLTDRRIVRRVGVLRVSVFQATLRQIQHTSVFRLLRERIFGLGTIGFATAGSETFDVFWMTVRRPFVVHKTVVEAIDRYGKH